MSNKKRALLIVLILVLLAIVPVAKMLMFTVNERVELIREAVKGWDGVAVDAFDGLLELPVDLALLGIAEVEAVRQRAWTRPGDDDAIGPEPADPRAVALGGEEDESSDMGGIRGRLHRQPRPPRLSLVPANA